MPLWIDLLDGPSGEVYADLPDPLPPNTDFQKPSVHEWQRFGEDIFGDTRVSGTGGLDQLQPLSQNAFASFGGREHKWDAGIIRFMLGDALTDDLKVPDGTLFGVHFNTNRGPEDIPTGGENTGYAVFVEKNSFDVHTVNIYRVEVGDKKGSLSPIGVLQPEADNAVLPGDTIEVRWGYAAITDMDHLGAEWGIKVFIGDPDQPETDAVLVYNDFDPDMPSGPGADSDVHVSRDCREALAGQTAGSLNWLTQV